MWQLDKSGNLKEIDRAEFAADETAFEFPAHSDGRGFSEAKRLKLAGSDQTLIATGKLIPDQARLAFQSGFDLIEIDDEELTRHGETAWREALKSAVDANYVEGGVIGGGDTTSGKGIWSQRFA